MKYIDECGQESNPKAECVELPNCHLRNSTKPTVTVHVGFYVVNSHVMDLIPAIEQ